MDEKDKIQSILFRLERWSEESKVMYDTTNIKKDFWDGKYRMCEQIIELINKTFELK